MSAISLVKIILRARGDDTAGAVDDLMRVGGFPESVAKRIVSGELPMDEASRMARASEQGYGPVLYHGSTNPDMKEIAPMEVGKRNATGGNGLFLTDNPRVASTYAYDARVNGGKGPEGGSIYPLRVRDAGPDNWVTVKDRGHRGEEYSTFWDEIPVENIRGMDTDIYEPGQYLETDQINRAANRQGKTLVEYTNIYDSGEDVYSVGGTEVPSNVTAVLDNTLVRSPNAAYDPQYSGPNIMGGLLAGGVGLGALGQSKDADAGFVTKGGKTLLEAFHGSPHKFDKFSMDQIGTGEGAQAYGHGLYFADSEDVARGYRDRLSGDSASMYGGLDIKWDGQEVPEAYREAASYLNDPLVMGEAKTNDAAGLAGVLDSLPGYEDSAKWLRDNSDKITATPSGNLYRTEIDVTPESLLDWDKPLSEQSEAVRNGLMETEYFKNLRSDMLSDQSRYVDSVDNILGSSTYEDIVEHASNFPSGQRPEEFSGQLSDRGVKGIKYLDGDSRAVGDGTSNYVIFDDGLINIAERGNATVPMLGATAAGTAGLLAAPALMKDEPIDPTAPLPAPPLGEQMAKAGSLLMDIVDLPTQGLQGIARGLLGVMNGEDIVTAGAEAKHMMDGGSQEGFDRFGEKVEGLLAPIDKRFPYLNAGKAAGDTASLLASLLSF